MNHSYIEVQLPRKIWEIVAWAICCHVGFFQSTFLLWVRGQNHCALTGALPLLSQPFHAAQIIKHPPGQTPAPRCFTQTPKSRENFVPFSNDQWNWKMEADSHLFVLRARVRLFSPARCGGPDTAMLLFSQKKIKQLVRTDMGLCQLWWERSPERCERLIIYSKQQGFNGRPEQALLPPLPSLSGASYRHSSGKCRFTSSRKSENSIWAVALPQQHLTSPPVDFNPHFFLIFVSNACTE